jgi:hypothetical protein
VLMLPSLGIVARAGLWTRLHAPAIPTPMCNFYSLTKGQAAIRDWFRARHDRIGNLPLLPGIFPDQMAPIVRRSEDGERELVLARWGMPGPPQFGGQPITTSATSRARTGADGLDRNFAASSQRHRFASTKTPSRARRPPGSIASAAGDLWSFDNLLLLS